MNKEFKPYLPSDEAMRKRLQKKRRTETLISKLLMGIWLRTFSFIYKFRHYDR